MGEEEKKICGFNMAAEGEEPDYCRKPVHNTLDRCIFHADLSAKETPKDKRLFLDRFKDHIKESDKLIDCRGFKFSIGGRLFEDREFYEIVDFSRAQFQEEVIFVLARFDKAAIFTDAEFGSGVVFADTEFRGPAVFNNTKFKGHVYFHKTLFYDEAEFTRTEIGKGARFILTEFGIDPSKDTNFDYVGFIGVCIFIKSVFNSDVVFEESVFKGETVFEETEFRKHADFSGVEINGKLHLKGLGKLAKRRTTKREEFIRGATEFTNIAPEIDLTNISLYGESTLALENFDLGECSFADTPAISQALFKKTSWLGTGKPRRKHTRDESLAERGVIHYETAAEVYRRLRENFEERLSYSEAGDFHIGEMHIRRLGFRQKGWKRFFNCNWCFLHLYRIFGGYGERIRNPIISFIAVGLAFASLWSLIGFPVPDGENVRITHNLGYAILFSFKTFLTLPGKALCLVQDCLGATQRTIGVGIITLFILALRRAFRR